MEKLLPFYERELSLFNRNMVEFARRFPKTAGKLMIAEGQCEDPHTQHLIQSFALLTARVAKQIEDSYPQFTESLLETNHPHYLRPFPSCSIVRVEPGAADAPAVTLGRGAIMQSAPVRGVPCKFRTVYDLALAPVRLAEARFDAIVAAPKSLRLPAGATSSISIVIESAAADYDLRPFPPGRLRLFVDGEASFSATLLDTLFRRCVRAYVETDDGPDWIALERIPLALAGLAEDEALIPYPARSQPAFRLLAEYFTYPEKFHFIDLDWAPLRPILPAGCRRFTLHLALKGWRGDSDEARMLAGLSGQNLLTGCTPVVNLFSKPGVPIALTHTGADYPLRADAAHTFGYEIHTIESVELVRKEQGEQIVTAFQPLYSSRHGAANKGNYWLARRDEALACVSPGHELSITLIDPAFTPTGAARATLSTMLTCTNRDLPGALRFGRPEGDLRCHQVPDGQPIRLLRKPSAPCRFGAGEAHWRLIAHLSLNYSGLTNAGLGEFQRMLSLYDLPRSAISQRQINGVTGLEHGIARLRVGSGARAALMPGVAIRMRIDEQAFAGASVVVFAQVIERYFALHRQLNCFTQLTIVSDKSGEELIACPPRTAEPPRA